MVFKRHDPKSGVTPELKPEQSWTSTANKLADGASIIGSDLVIEGPSITMRRCHVKQFYCRNVVTRRCSTFVFSMP